LARLVLLDLDVFMLTQFNEGQAISSLFLASFSLVSPQRLEIRFSGPELFRRASQALQHMLRTMGWQYA
jgi:hypothetical protein